MPGKITAFINSKANASKWTLRKQYISTHRDERNKILSNHTFPENIYPQNVIRVQQPYLYASFILRSLEYRISNKNKKSETLSLYHHTKKENVKSILSLNLDYRKVQRYRYGYGTSFTNDMAYGLKFSSAASEEGVIVVLDVLVGNQHTCDLFFNKKVILDDTVISRNRKVVVKFRDDEFYPKYLIYYSVHSK